MKVIHAHIKQFALGVICILSVTSCTVNEHYTRCHHRHDNRKEVVVVKPPTVVVTSHHHGHRR